MQELNAFQLYNQVLYRPNGVYATIIELAGESAVVKSIMSSYNCSIDKLQPITFNDNMPTLLGFEPLEGFYVKRIESGDQISLKFDESNKVLVWWNDDQIYRLSYLHQVQNAYHLLSGTMPSPNIYGVKT